MGTFYPGVNLISPVYVHLHLWPHPLSFVSGPAPLLCLWPRPQSGHLPAVRVWDVAERLQVGQLLEHKFGVACVAFSPNGKYIVSVGYQHDMMVNVWNWKVWAPPPACPRVSFRASSPVLSSVSQKNVLVAANKVSSKVSAVSFSDDSSYFVTAGNRHVKFWYLDHAQTSKVGPLATPLSGAGGVCGPLSLVVACR